MDVEDVKRWANVRPGYWFAPKLFGWGATPVTWQGWASVAVLIGAGAAVAWLAHVRGPWLLALWVPLVVGFLALLAAKTDGSFRWRWGDTDRD